MDPQQTLRLLSDVRHDWTHFAKDKVEEPVGKNSGYLSTLFFQHTYYQILVYILMGPRCGLYERCIIIDTRPKEVEIDHLVASANRLFSLTSPTFFHLPPEVLRVKKTRNKVALSDAIKSWLETELKGFRNNPESCDRYIKDFVDEQFLTVPGLSVHCSMHHMTRV